MFNRRTLLSFGVFALVLSFSGAALADAVGVSSPTSKLKCRTVQETDCLADPHGHVYGCHTHPATECTVVSGPGSGKTKQFVPAGQSNGASGGSFRNAGQLGAGTRTIHRR